tara:strand:- start:1637 stop:1954 length:318 start_codon:yes stop_codon:yes gene_type:complete
MNVGQIGAKPIPKGDLKMNDIIENKFILKGESYIADLEKVDFLTWNENDKVKGTYFMKFHIGTKETRYICSSKTELLDIIKSWCSANGKNVDINENDIGDWLARD